MRRPPLTSKVVRGLHVLRNCAPAVDVINGAATPDEIDGYATREDLEDAFRAAEWIDQVVRWDESRRRERE